MSVTRSAARDVHSQAAENLRYIRAALESAGAFTAVPGWGQVAVGGTAIVTALVARLQPTANRWLAAWLAEAVLAAAIAGVAIVRKSRRRGLPLFSGAARRFWPAFIAPLVAGALLTAALYGLSMYELMPPVWLMLFGTAVVGGGSVSVPIVRVMGFCFLTVGAITLAFPGAADLLLAAGFGGLLIGFGVAIARKQGG
jgi:hypothetical protein